MFYELETEMRACHLGHQSILKTSWDTLAPVCVNPSEGQALGLPFYTTVEAEKPPSPLRSSLCIWPTQPLPYRKYCFLGLLPWALSSGPALMGAPYNCSLFHSLIFPLDIPSLAAGDLLFLPRNFSKAFSFSPTSIWHLLQAECWSFNWRLGDPLTPDVSAFYPPQSPEAMITKPGLGYEMQGRKI